MHDLAAVFYDLFFAPLHGGWNLRDRVARLARPLVPRGVYKSGKKLNLGCGDKPLPSYINVDIVAAYKPDVVGNVARLSFAHDEEYDLVRASHVLEHFGHEESRRVLMEWRRVLRPGGYLVICCPDYTRLSWRAILCPDGFDIYATKYNASEHQGWVSGLFALDLPPELRHKAVFTERSLRHFLEHTGFSVIGRQVYQVEHPYTLGIIDNSCNVYSVNLVAQKV